MVDPVQTPVDASGPVTKADVLAALGDTDPNSTNAGKLRAIIGRGGNTTIQNFLNEIRDALLVVPTAPGTAPVAPADAVAAIWSAAWSAAQVHTLSRLDAATAQRDALQALTVAQKADVLAYGVELDEKNAQIEQLKIDLETLGVKLLTADSMLQHQSNQQVSINQSMSDELAKLKADAVAELAKVRAEHDAEILRVKTESAHAAEIASAVESRMQIELSRLTDQIAELKSHLWKRIDAPAEPEKKAKAVTEK